MADLARLAQSTAVRIVLAIVLVGVGVLGASGLRLAEDQAETTAPVVAEQCRNGQAAQVEAIAPGACGTAADVEDQGAGSVTVAGPSGTPGAPGTEGVAGQPGPTGTPGIPGPVGAGGQTGTPGTPGRAGETGAAGPTGAAGQDGISVQGPPGGQGEPGPPGPTGASGDRGPAGAPGDPGAPGRDGSPAEAQTFTTPSGVVYACTRSGGDDTAPTYTCTTG